jgi:RNA polymerase sigma factor (TIGR02999 family)
MTPQITSGIAVAENSLTTVLQSWNASHDGMQGAAFNDLIGLCYEQLRGMAATRVRDAGSVSISPTELLHDAILGVGESDVKIKNSEHFLATMSLKMRSLLVDHARHNLATRHGGEHVRITMTELELEGTDLSFELIALDEAFQQLDELEPRSAQVMHLTYFAGMGREDIAKLLDVSLPTVDRELRFGRAFTMESMRNEN